ncbi:AlbA family DNA-binding domain-containing protein [Candidatus Halobonum tyrrellensis]|uniref:AlbA family DNA-binding domain-containing protein n=1 Tax=Candidatus Halobonum tyrrellensis TaxID=1431545 RepID=UPI0009B5A52C|nr:ATP-binding protein [Candidatus Halobonum tyrrellensis]
MSWSDDSIDERLEEADIREIFYNGISPTIEFFLSTPSKIDTYSESSIPSEADLAREACGIGNRSGGVILFGVGKSGEVKGITDTEEGIDEIAEIFEDQIEPDLSYDLYAVEIDNKFILVSRIKKYTETDAELPFAVQGQFFYRKSKHSYPMSPSTLKAILESSTQ